MLPAEVQKAIWIFLLFKSYLLNKMNKGALISHQQFGHFLHIGGGGVQWKFFDLTNYQVTVFCKNKQNFEVAQKLSQVDLSCFPKVLSVDLSSACYTERLEVGRQLSICSAKKISNKLPKLLAEICSSQKSEQKPLCDAIHHLREEYKKCIFYLERIGEIEKALPFIRIIDELFFELENCGLQFYISAFSHGDIAPSNVILTDKRAIAIDPLSAGYRPFLFDIFGCYCACKENEEFRRAFSNLKEWIGAVFFEIQNYFDQNNLSSFKLARAVDYARLYHLCYLVSKLWNPIYFQEVLRINQNIVAMRDELSRKS